MNADSRNTSDPRTRPPRYVRVYTTLREWIRNGKYGPGDKIATEDEIGKLFKVSRITTRKAIDLLVEDELVYRVHGKGTYVAKNVRERGGVENVHARIRTARGLAQRSKVTKVNVSEIDADSRVATDLKIPVGQRVTKVSYVRVFRGVPAAYVEAHVPADRAEIRASDLGSMTILAILEKQGIQIGEAHQLIGATLADSHLAAMLDSAVGAPLLTIEQIVMDTSNRPVERFFTWYNCEQYEHPALVFDRNTLEFVHGVAASR